MSSEDDPGIDLDLPENLEEYTFDEWRDLHESDPRRFDLYRLKMLNDFIDAAPAESQPRLRGLMFKMEGESRRSKSQLGFNLRLSAMMMEMLDEMRQQLRLLYAADVDELERELAKPPSAEVIPFAERVADRERN